MLLQAPRLTPEANVRRRQQQRRHRTEAASMRTWSRPSRLRLPLLLRMAPS